MKRISKITSVIVIAAIMLCFAACSGTKTEEFSAWFNDEFSPAYDAFVQTEAGKTDAPAPDISLMITSDKYLNCVFEYIAKGTQPEKGEISEENGIYTYTENTFSQKIEFDEKTTSIRITDTISFMGETMTKFTVIMSERDGKYYIQYLRPEFSEYYEVCFTADGGEIKHESRNELPYTIFAEDIPKDFAKES